MVDVKYMMNEHMKEFMREITMSVRNYIKETLKDVMNTQRGNKNRSNNNLTTGTNNQR